jgi:hypothetical protein
MLGGVQRVKEADEVGAVEDLGGRVLGPES